MIEDPRELESEGRHPKHREIHILPIDANAAKPQHRVILLAGGKIRSVQEGNLSTVLEQLAVQFAGEMMAQKMGDLLTGRNRG